MNDRPNPTSAIRSLKVIAEEVGSRLVADLVRPIHGFRLAYLPLVMVYFAYGALGIIDVSRDLWIKEQLTFTPAEAFYGTLRQTAAIIAVAALWLFSKQLTEYSVTTVLFWLAIAGTVLSLPNIGLFYGLHEWTQAMFGYGARSIALVNAATASPLAELSMIPLLTLIAFYATPGHRATWFALMASLMNTALVAGQLQTKYLNQIFVVDRGDYAELGSLLIATTVIGLIVPIAAIVLFGRRV